MQHICGSGLELLQGIPSEASWKRGGQGWNRSKHYGRRHEAGSVEAPVYSTGSASIGRSSEGDGVCGCSGEEGCSPAYRAVLGNESVRQFLVDIMRHFRGRVEKLQRERRDRQQAISTGKYHLQFHPPPPPLPFASSSSTTTSCASYGTSLDWRISPLPKALLDRMVDVGDCNPADAQRWCEAMHTPNVSAVQVDMDDGFCPNWANVVCGLYHVMLAVRGQLYEHVNQTKPTTPMAYMMFRPRAWNMMEPNVLVDGVRVAGALFDFGLFMYHNARLLHDKGTGPFLYLSKVEAASEAHLWDDVFTWTEQKLQLPHGCTKGCVLIESLPAVFQMPNILFALRTHSAGLNCGLWDYAASFISRLGDRALFPDRSKYVSMDRHFLKSYRQLLVDVCHRYIFHRVGFLAD
eukprot:GHVS01019145.1.p1 GENE.GHVS01019145.1~~GHVS01019145.1.p1  ORF type:complete len:406 (+),score=54.79 GHVS01019145.1:250-1467(+)